MGKQIALTFDQDSIRTRCAFEVAAYDVGARVAVIVPVYNERSCVWRPGRP